MHVFILYSNISLSLKATSYASNHKLEIATITPIVCFQNWCSIYQDNDFSFLLSLITVISTSTQPLNIVFWKLFRGVPTKIWITKNRAAKITELVLNMLSKSLEYSDNVFENNVFQILYIYNLYTHRNFTCCTIPIIQILFFQPRNKLGYVLYMGFITLPLRRVLAKSKAFTQRLSYFNFQKLCSFLTDILVYYKL